MYPNLQYFESLREMINHQLIEPSKNIRINHLYAIKQINEYPWLYGALGKVPAAVMFICENPSLSGVEKAHVDTIDGGPPDIEAQWWGGSSDKAALCFRPALCRLNLKTTFPWERGGWECYITNVIKQANVAKDQEKLTAKEERQQARDWSSILQWELDHIKPKYIFCVGGSAFKLVQLLIREDKLNLQILVHEVMHYSARLRYEKIISEIVFGVQEVIGSLRT